jgi:hypothetical protein
MHLPDLAMVPSLYSRGWTRVTVHLRADLAAWPRPQVLLQNPERTHLILQYLFLLIIDM